MMVSYHMNKYVFQYMHDSLSIFLNASTYFYDIFSWTILDHTNFFLLSILLKYDHPKKLLTKLLHLLINYIIIFRLLFSVTLKYLNKLIYYSILLKPNIRTTFINRGIHYEFENGSLSISSCNYFWEFFYHVFFFKP